MIYFYHLFSFFKISIFSNVNSQQDAPYLMYKDEETKLKKPKCGKENFVGFCADLAKKVAKIVNIDYDICIVKDGKYGEKLVNGTWNGIIGELTRDVSWRMRIQWYLFSLEILMFGVWFCGVLPFVFINVHQIISRSHIEIVSASTTLVLDVYAATNGT